MKSRIVRWGLAALMAGAIAGCGGGGGGGVAVAPAPGGGSSSTLAPAPVPTGSTPVNVASLTVDQFAALEPQATVGGAVVASPPQVSFALSDSAGNPIIGFGSTSKSSTATVASYANLAFGLAKLVPGTNGAPSKWVSYIVTTVPTTTAAATAQRPGTDNTGTLVDNKNGTYTYTFYRDVTKIKDQVAAMTLTGTNVAADLGDLTFDPNAVHRLTIQISGNVPGTGTNTANAVQLTPGVPMKNPVNVIYDFIPATGKAVTAANPSRDIVATAKCQECHSKLGDDPGATKLIDNQGGTSRVVAGAGFHGGARYDTRYCVVCHTDQRKYGQTRVTSTNLAFPALTRTVTQSSTTGLYSASYSPTTYVADGDTIGDFPRQIHKIHMGEELVKKNYNYANVTFNEVTYPQPITNCTKCHDGSATSTAKTTNGDNWKSVPSRLACGACHDGINFSTGKGVTLADARNGLTTSAYGHIGGSQSSDANCQLCHTAADIPVYHLTVDPKLSDANWRAWYNGKAIPVASQLGTLPAGVYKINFEIKQASVSNGKAVVVYRILKDGAPVTLNTTGMLINNVDQSPGIMVAWAVPQDGNSDPSDWNVVYTAGGGATVKDIRDAKNGHSQTGPDASGYYTATVATVPAIPANAKMVTVAMGVTYAGMVQLGHPSYPDGIMLREPKFVIKTADGYTARRSIVDANKCNNCHGQLGVLPTFHGGARNNGEGCAMCHDPNRATGHVGRGNPTGTPVPTPNYYGGGWSVQVKNLVHGIHASTKRTEAFSYEASPENPVGFKEVTYPGILRNCEQCHVPGSYDFSGAANAAALPKLLWTTDAKGNMTNPQAPDTVRQTPIGQSPWVTRLGRGEVDYTSDNLVSSPIASSCFGCHDSSAAVTHMQQNGGTLVTSASTVSTGGDRNNGFNKAESCMFCHNSTSAYGLGIKAVHAKK